MDRGMMYAIFGVAWIFGWALFAVLVSYLSDKSRQRQLELMHEERMKAMEKGVPLPELADWEALLEGREPGGRPAHPRRSLGVAAILFAGGLGTSLALFLAGPGYARLWPLGLVAVFLAAGFVWQYRLLATGNPSSARD